jgi:hypothetical protein
MRPAAVYAQDLEVEGRIRRGFSLNIPISPADLVI